MIYTFSKTRFSKLKIYHKIIMKLRRNDDVFKINQDNLISFESMQVDVVVWDCFHWRDIVGVIKA